MPWETCAIQCSNPVVEYLADVVKTRSDAERALQRLQETKLFFSMAAVPQGFGSIHKLA